MCIIDLMYMCLLLNHAYNSGIIGKPITKATGSTADIISLLRFHFWKPIYYKVDDSDFLSESTEKRSPWVGIAEHIGHAMTFKVLTDDNQEVFFRSKVLSSEELMESNIRFETLCGRPYTFSNCSQIGKNKVCHVLRMMLQ